MFGLNHMDLNRLVSTHIVRLLLLLFVRLFFPSLYLLLDVRIIKYCLDEIHFHFSNLFIPIFLQIQEKLASSMQ